LRAGGTEFAPQVGEVFAREVAVDWKELGLTAARATAVYAFMLLTIRLLGKRSVGNLTAFDLLVALMLGEVADEIIYADVTIPQGFLSIAVIAFWHFTNSWASYKSKFIDRLTGASPRVLVENGQIVREALAAERMNEQELWSQLRLESVDDLNEVKRATLEPSGQVSVIKQDWAKELQKGDLRQPRSTAA
jgi:uncharacterized membrane protein YcaP (DUF421 family)